jgi:hypothetical protein
MQRVRQENNTGLRRQLEATAMRERVSGVHSLRQRSALAADRTQRVRPSHQVVSTGAAQHQVPAGHQHNCGPLLPAHHTLGAVAATALWRRAIAACSRGRWGGRRSLLLPCRSCWLGQGSTRRQGLRSALW